MVKDEPVSMLRQTIYCLIPFLDIYAAYRVTRLRKYLLIMILVGIPVSIADTLLFPIDVTDDIPFEELETSEMIFYGYDTNHFAATAVAWAGFILLAIFLVRRWSKQWNQKFQTTES